MIRIFDRFLLREFLKFVLIALGALVGIYILIDLFEDLSYFMARRVPLGTVLLHYVYFAPSAITLLYPVSFVLACFMVYGSLTRQRELSALQSAGVNTYRLFRPILIFGLISIPLFYFANELVSIPAAVGLEGLRRYTIEKRSTPGAQRRKDMNYLAEDGRVFFAREFEESGLLRDFMVVEFDSARRRMVKRTDGKQADYRDGRWYGKNVHVREFPTDSTEVMHSYDTLTLADITETPRDFALEARPVEQQTVPQLLQYIAHVRRSGYATNKEMVELHYRYSYACIGFILLLMCLPLSVQLRKGGVMLGLGLGMLFSFLYWGVIQTCKAFGQSGALSPLLAAWLPNVLFLIAGVLLLPTVRR